jgi:hypothetical protein
MAEGKDLGKSLINIGVFVFMVPILTEMIDTLWYLFIVGASVFLVGVMIKVGQTGQSLPMTATQGIAPHLPTSKGVDFIEKIVGFADNPDTAVMSIGKQPEGTHPTMLGILDSEFTSQAESYDRGSNQGDFAFDSESYGRSSNRGDFEIDEYNEFADHGHERVLPLDIVDPVSHWFNPEDEWQNPTKYW